MKYDIRYIFRKVLIFFIIFFILTFFRSCEVFAETHPISNNNSRVRLYPSSQYSTFDFNAWYSLPSGQSLYGLDFKFDTGYKTEYEQETLYAGSYLFDFIIETNNLTDHLSSCKGISGVDFRFTDLTSGNVIIPARSSAGTCLDSYYTTIGGNRAIHYLFQWQVNDTASYPFMFNEFEFIIYNYTGEGFVKYGGSYLIILGNLVDYDPEIVSNFKSFSQRQKLHEETILNATQNAQNIINATQQSTQNIINSQSIINGSINNIGIDTTTIINQQNANAQQAHQDSQAINNTLNDSSTASNQDFNDAVSSVTNSLPTNSTISSLVTMPITFLQKIIDALGGTCSPIVIGELFDYNMTMPCIDPTIYIGFIWNIIDVICAGFFAYYFGKKLVVIFHNVTSMNEGGLKDAYD